MKFALRPANIRDRHIINLGASIPPRAPNNLTPKSETKMARCWLHVVCEDSYLDETGCLFDNPEQAIAYATTIERELAADGTYNGCTIRVIDEREREGALFRIGQTES